MNGIEKYLEIASDKIGISILQKYLLHNEFVKKDSKREDIAIFFRETPDPIELILPLKRELIDFKSSIASILSKIALIEKRSIEQVINDLLLPPSDILRFRKQNKGTENGLIPFQEGFSLLENVKKSLYSAACDLVSPSTYHKRLSNKTANQFIDSCFLGQTERGSFIVSVVCPFINESREEKPIQLSLFHEEETLQTSLTRRVTQKYISSLIEIKQDIQDGNLEQLEEKISEGKISANFIETITELGEYGEGNNVIDISVSWSNHLEKVTNIPDKISFTTDLIQPMVYLVDKFRPKEESSKGSFVGKISAAKANPDAEKRDTGEIVFNFVSDDDKIVKAKVNLNAEQFSEALKALDKGGNVKIDGDLVNEGKSKFIINPNFSLI